MQCKLTRKIPRSKYFDYFVCANLTGRALRITIDGVIMDCTICLKKGEVTYTIETSPAPDPTLFYYATDLELKEGGIE
jgi:hypothetical protein